MILQLKFRMEGLRKRKQIFGNFNLQETSPFIKKKKKVHLFQKFFCKRWTFRLRPFADPSTILS